MFRIFRNNLKFYRFILFHLYYTAKYPQNGWCIILVTVSAFFLFCPIAIVSRYLPSLPSFLGALMLPV